MLRMLLRKSAILALLATCLISTGCTWQSLHLLIPNFDASALQGVEIFRLADDSGQPAPAGGLEFISVDTQTIAGVDHELLKYRVVNLDGTKAADTLFAEVFRDPAEPELVELRLLYQLVSPPGFYKVSTYNASGSSPLSAEQVQLL